MSSLSRCHVVQGSNIESNNNGTDQVTASCASVSVWAALKVGAPLFGPSPSTRSVAAHPCVYRLTFFVRETLAIPCHLGPPLLPASGGHLAWRACFSIVQNGIQKKVEAANTSTVVCICKTKRHFGVCSRSVRFSRRCAVPSNGRRRAHSAPGPSGHHRLPPPLLLRLHYYTAMKPGDDPYAVVSSYPAPTGLAGLGSPLLPRSVVDSQKRTAWLLAAFRSAADKRRRTFCLPPRCVVAGRPPACVPHHLAAFREWW